MQVYPDKLEAQLKRQLAAAYLIAGDESLLQRDAVDAIRASAAEAGFTTIETTVQDASFDWQAWRSSCSEMSLFGEQRLLELRLSTAAIGVEGSKAICEYLSNPAPDSILLVTAPRISGKPKWLSQFIQAGVYTPIYPVDSHALPTWLAARATRHGLRLQREAAQLIAEKVEGNLLAAVQELEKLSLLFANANNKQAVVIDLEKAAKAVGDSARFSAFNMLDHALAGQPQSASRALAHLKNEGNDPAALTGPVSYELGKIASLLELKENKRLADGIKSLRLPPKKREIYQRALPRINQTDISRCTMLTARADLLGKSGQRAAAYNAIEMMLLRLAGTPMPNENAILDYSFR
ncbi:MAG: DNA polymerase III subunit delta [Gammaproteobacteria bacterium]|nr:DNA polymerase III subunit delta [Gammaproteobacteria bacterium]RZV52118.1 MAG: DNA polymerase III subunit delta [Pseudomonadales bacterium]